MSGFSQVVRESTFSRGYNKDLVEGTFLTILVHMVQIFRANNRYGPRLNHGGNAWYILQRQYRGYNSQDQAKKKSKSPLMMLFRKILDLAVTRKESTPLQLYIGVLLFTIKSCEYLKCTHSEGYKRTNILRLRNINFKKDGKLLTHGSPRVSLSDFVTVKFEVQTNKRRDNAVCMFKTNYSISCPVKTWEYVATHICTLVLEASHGTRVWAFMDQRQIW